MGLRSSDYVICDCLAAGFNSLVCTVEEYQGRANEGRATTIAFWAFSPSQLLWKATVEEARHYLLRLALFHACPVS